MVDSHQVEGKKAYLALLELLKQTVEVASKLINILLRLNDIRSSILDIALRLLYRRMVDECENMQYQ